MIQLCFEYRCIVRQHRRHGKHISALIGNHVNFVYAMLGKIILNLVLMTEDLFIKGLSISVLYEFKDTVPVNEYNWSVLSGFRRYLDLSLHGP